MASTIFERCGGFATVRKVVSEFYDKVLESEQLSKYFVDVDMRKQIDHQTKFVASAMGGPAPFTDEHLERVHARLNISRSDFAELIELFQETLEDLDFEQADIERVAGELKNRERFIVSP